MALRFTVLASGSGGNASLVEAGGFGVLIDAGLGPRQLASRLAAAGHSWASVHAVLLTHTHSDHWKDRSLAHLHRRRVPLLCHPGHHDTLADYSPGFADLHGAGLVRVFQPDADFDLAPGLRCRALPVRHDGGPTFGFRLEATSAPAALAYAADLGCWDDGLADALADVDLLAVEFNHDVELERLSGRMPRLIARVLGDDGHLSNAQAAALVRAVLARSPAGRLRHLVQLHLSRDCNRPSLARAAARAALDGHADGVTVHTAEQDRPGAPIHLTPWAAPACLRPSSAARERRRSASAVSQRSLPGLFDDLPADEAV
jgi:ribonuclease BN (tRNA processing enzyme)